jgi:hypothetical protein
MRRRHETEFKGPRGEPGRAAPTGQFGDEDQVDRAGLRRRQDTSPALGPDEFRPLRTHAYDFAAAA